ncbi:hypothetical protein P7C71_g3042, partial [Lecanoromycetidae sp. Uapishka_2]
MRHSALHILVALLNIPQILATQYAPFTSPRLSPISHYNGLINLDLFRRDSKCPNDCSNLNSMACCPEKTNCALDEVGNIACCPDNAACTGTAGTPAAATGAPAKGSGPSTASAAAITHAISGASTVANSFYPFPYLPTTYANAAVCTSSFSSCQLESAKCTGLLEGGGMAVTINGPGGGVTQAGAMMPASAESICSSLSAEACHGLNLAQCSTLGGAKATGTANAFIAGSANAAPTRCAALYGMGMGVGVAVGLAGQVVG